MPLARPFVLLLAALTAAAVLLSVPGLSTAAFTSRTETSAGVRAAADWTAPAVTLQDPGASVKDTVTLTAQASDDETGVRDVIIQYSNGSGWVTVCVAVSAPYSCAWNTKDVADGSYSLRARATDNAGYSTISDTVNTTVANALLVVLGNPGEVVRGMVNLTATLHNTGGLSYTVRIEYSAAGVNKWSPICSSLVAPYSCAWSTTGVTNGEYDLRAVAVSGLTSYYSALVPEVLVDNQAPTVTMTDPGTPLSGTHTFAATAADAHSGIALVLLQYAVTGSTTYQELCRVVDAPYSCRFDTTKLADGSYSFRAVATDVAGNSTASGVVTNRVVNNTVSSVSLEDPGAFLTGTVTLNASANSTAGVVSVVMQRAANGGSTWTNLCTVNTAPYSCGWETTTLPDGLYDLRAVLLDGSGRTTVSGVVAARRVDNSPLRGIDVQAVNGGGAVGRMDAGDRIILTYSQPVHLASVTPGWSGGALTVSVRLRDGNLLGLGNQGDTLDVQRSGSVVNLGAVNLKADFIKSNKTAVFNASMTAGSTMVDGVTRTAVTLQLSSVASGAASLRTPSSDASMVWTPSASVVDLQGRACSTAPVSETGAADRDF